MRDPTGWTTDYALKAIADAQRTTTKETDEMPDDTTRLHDLEAAFDEAYRVAAALRDTTESADLRKAADGLASVALTSSRTAAFARSTTAPAKRDATAAELRSEPDLVLQDLAAGHLGATNDTQRLAQAEIDYRRLRT